MSEDRREPRFHAPCRRPKRRVADVELDGHNGKRSDSAVRVALPCRRKQSG